MHRVSTLAVLAALIPCTGGCSTAIWNAYAYNVDQVETQRGDTPVLVYFRHWADPDCTKFEQNVLEGPDVRSAMMPLYRVVLNYSHEDKERGQSWGVTDTPGVAILGTRGRVLAVLSDVTSKDALLALIQRGTQEYEAQKSAGVRATGGP